VVQSPVEATVNTAIIFHGPGSWKRDAYWDEYVLTIANRGTVPLMIDSASLVGLAGQPVAPDSDPWTLEKASRTLEGRGFGLGQAVGVQVGGGLAAITTGAATGALIVGTYGAAGPYVLAYGAFGGLAALPIFIGGTVYRNVSNRHDIEREFQRRRLAMPATLAPGQVVQGSCFFPITPGPERLTLHGRSDRESVDVAIDLAPLKGLHLTPAAGTPPPAIGTPP
jgi:hypothetical protein